MVVALDRRLLGVLPPLSLYAVGGRVRDEIRLGDRFTAPADLDYVVVGVELDDLVSRLERIGRVDAVGASFSVLKVSGDGWSADVALPRRERSTGSGHRDFAIDSGPDVRIEDDLARRDFRMNMIARRLDDGLLVDPFGGAADIIARKIDILAPESFEEDPLRMLRAAQFAARFEYGVTDRTQAAMTGAGPLLKTISAERVGVEMAKLLQSVRPSLGLELLRQTGVMAHLWPELLEGDGCDQNEWHAYDVYRHNLATADAAPSGDLTGRLAALLHDVGKPRTKDGPHFYGHEHVGADLVPAMLARLRLPVETVETVTHLVRHHMYAADPDLADKSIRRFIRRIGEPHLARLFALRHADIAGSGLPKRDDSNERFEARVAAVLAERPALAIRDLAIGGGDVIAILQRKRLAPPDFRGDARVGETLAALFEEVTDHPDRNDPALLAARAERYVDEHFVSQ